MPSIKQIKAFSNKIAREYHPEQIVLFGSYAEGTPTPDSDVDLLVILPFKGRTVDKTVEMRLKFHPPFPIDLLVRTPQKVKQRLKMGDTFIQDILERGKVLYEAHHG